MIILHVVCNIAQFKLRRTVARIFNSLAKKDIAKFANKIEILLVMHVLNALKQQHKHQKQINIYLKVVLITLDLMDMNHPILKICILIDIL